ncbi:nucleotidyltransferase family protein [Asanoa sp. NPDC049573]|uniref:nucleotidyltransferase family protein n=1 Tax=Asanoa sp. NPDC049573 TaxID=3155396 RepID=UPI0034425B8D
MDELRALVTACPWLMAALTAVRDSGLPDAWIGAGVLRDLVWDERFGSGFDPARVKDVDVAFFDPTDLARDGKATELLATLLPAVPWEATNQAAVHTWFHTHFGGAPVPPLVSLAEAVATWPETATAVAVRLDAAGGLEVCAPYGLTDLLGGVWRHNPRRTTMEQSRRRLARQQPTQRWPGVRVEPATG